MSERTTIKTRCPLCRAKYRVPAEAAGHRARCTGCKATFRVAEIEPRRTGLPTEDDILQWLNEGMDEEAVAARPRVVSAALQPTPTPTEGGEESAPKEPAEETQSRTPSHARMPHLRPVLHDEDTVLRKTG